MAMETRYACTGGCGGWVSPADFNAGQQTCGTQGCPNFGQPFVQKMHCTDCGADVDQGVAHSHEDAKGARLPAGQGKGGFFSRLFGR